MMPTADTWFVLAARAEALSWTGLLIGMFFKYVVVENEIGVKIFGPIHGALFVAYLVATAVVAWRRRWRLRTVVAAVVASIPPLATLLFEWFARRRGLLGAARTRPVTP